MTRSGLGLANQIEHGSDSEPRVVRGRGGARSIRSKTLRADRKHQLNRIGAAPPPLDRPVCLHWADRHSGARAERGATVIYTDEQFAISGGVLRQLEAGLEAARKRRTGLAWVRDLEVAALESQIGDIEAELREYRQLRDGQVALPEAPAVDELPKVLARARIRSGVSQGDLAARLGTTPEQVQRFEASDYEGASLDTLLAVSRAVGIDPA